MKQRAFTVVAPIHALREALNDLRAIGANVRAPGSNPFVGHKDLHFLSCCIIDGAGDDPPSLVLELSFDGRAREFLSSFVEQRRAALDQIMQHCDGYPAARSGTAEIIGYLEKRSVKANVFYLGHPGRTVSRIETEHEQREALREQLGKGSFETREELWKSLRATVPHHPAPRLPFWVRFSLRGKRGPKRVAAGLRVLAGGVARVVGIAAFAALNWWAWAEGSSLHRVAAFLAPLVLAVCVGGRIVWEGPKHLEWSGRRVVLGEALRRGGGAYLSLAIAMGLGALVLNAWWMPWASGWPVLEPVRAALGAALGSLILPLQAVFVSILFGAIVAVGYVLAEAVGAVVVAAGALVMAYLVTGPDVLGASLRDIAQLGLGPIFVALLLLLVMLFAAAGTYLPLVRRREQQDDVAGIRWNNVHLRRMTEHEDLQLQNHFASVTIIKDGWRRWQLSAVLRLSKLLVKFYFNQGDLAGIPSIHFARFVILPGHRFLFQTNYDGGWANYLGEFTQVPGVTGVWGSTRSFPRPFLVFGDGARDEQRFKTYARNSQVETLVWHSAYPGLGVADINRNTSLGEDLARPLDDPDQKGWFAKARRYWKRPLDEAALDEAIRRI